MPNVSLPKAEEMPTEALSAISATRRRSDIWFVSAFTAALAFVSSVPYLVGYFLPIPGKVFNGTIDHSLDTNNYLAYVHQSTMGSWLFHNPMTLEPHAAVFFNLEWLIVGKIGLLFHLSAAGATGLCRLLWLVLLCVGVYWLSSFLFESVFMRRVALVACMAGGGFGWLATLHRLGSSLDSSYFLDLTNPNLFPFHWILRIPHFAAAEAFVVLGLCFFLRAETAGKIRDYVAAGGCYVAAGACRPYDMLLLMAATVIYLAASLAISARRGTAVALGLLPVMMCVPALGYYYWIFKIHPIFRWWSLPGGVAPHAWLLAVGFGLSFLLLPFAARELWRERLAIPRLLMLSCWGTAVVLMYTHRWLHFSFQFATNIAIPMILLVLAGMEKPIMKWRMSSRRATAAIVTLLFINSLTSLALTAQIVTLVRSGEYSTDADLLAAYAWLGQHSRASDAVLADFWTSNQMPQFIHNNVFCGYGNAVHVNDKLKAMNEFLDPATPNVFRQKLLRDNAIQFVLLTQQEAGKLGTLLRASFVNEVFRSDGAVILAVRSEGS